MAIATGSPLGQLIKDISPGANEDILASVIRSGAKIVVLTQSEYDSLAVKDTNSVYLIKAT